MNLRRRMPPLWALVLALPGTMERGAAAVPYNPNQIEVPGAVNQGFDLGGAVWGDYNGDGRLDILVSGRDAANNRQIRIYRNNGGADGAVTFTAVNVAAAGAGLQDSSVAFGDMDGDGDLDVLSGGVDSGGNRRLRVYRNDGGAFTLLPDVDALAAGANRSDVAWGDFDNDGDLDILVSGRDAGGRRLRVYRNNGNGTFDPNQIELAGTAGMDQGDVAWGDFDGDGNLDVAAAGQTGGAANSRRLRIYWNNGDPAAANPFTTTTDVQGAAAGYSLGEVRGGDVDGDGDLDLLVSGLDQAGNRQLRVFWNNGNRTFTLNAASEVPGAANQGYRNSSAVFGDANTDGRLDILLGGQNAAGQEEVRMSTFNAGTGLFTPPPAASVESAANLGLHFGGAALGDYDGDGDLDALVTGRDSGNLRQIRVYYSQAAPATANAAPAAPTLLAGRFAFDPAGLSVASFTWNTGSDSGTGATAAAFLNYDLQISTLAGFGRTAAPGLWETTPSMGAYLRPANLFGGATPFGVMLKSTSPWASNLAHPGLLTDTTYYFRVVTVDAGLRASGYSGTQTLWTGVAPCTSTLSAGAGFLPGDITLSWASAGDDLYRANLTGSYRIQYSSTAVAWSTSTTPAGAYTVTIPTTSVVPGSARSTTINVPTNDAYNFVLWSQDDVGLFSEISNVPASVPAPINRSVSVSPLIYNFGNQAIGTSSVTASAVVVANDGNVVNTYLISVATTTPGSPWTIGAAAGSDAVAVYAGFHAARPAAGAFGAEDAVLVPAQPATGARYSIDGSQTGVAVPVSGTRDLWFRLDAPTDSSTVLPQQVTVTVTAGPP